MRWAQEIAREAREMGVSLTDSQSWELSFHLAAVLQASRHLNLTRITDPGDALRLHVLDSLSCLPEVEGAPAGALADIGSGAGYPGIPLAIVTDRPVTLIEARARKASFLTHVALGLDHEIEVWPGRAEALSTDTPHAYSVVVARAVGSLAELLELASPLLRRGGRLVALKGSPTEDEMESARRTSDLVGMGEIVAREVSLPGPAAQRTVLWARKVGEASVPLPRRAGMAHKRPLG